MKLSTRDSGSTIALCAAIATLALLSACTSAPKAAGADAVSGPSPAGGVVPSITSDIAPETGAGRTLVVYFSQGSATKRVAEDLALVYGADTERIIEKKARAGGFFGFMGAGADSSMGRATPIQAPKADPSAYDRVIVCTPVWAWRLSPPVRSWLKLMKGRLPRAAFVEVSAGTAPEKIVAMMEAASGKKADAYAGFVQGDFDEGNRAAYLGKIRALVEGFRGP